MFALTKFEDWHHMSSNKKDFLSDSNVKYCAHPLVQTVGVTLPPYFLLWGLFSPTIITLHFPTLNHTYHFIVQLLLVHDLSAILSSHFVFSAISVPIPLLDPFMN